MAAATPMSPTGIHPRKDPGIVKSNRSIRSLFRRHINVEADFKDVELTEVFCFSFSPVEFSRVWGASRLERRSKTVLVIAMQIA